MSDMDQMDHKMPMGDDFAKKPVTDEKSATIPLISEDEADAVITKITSTTEHRADGKQIIKTPKDSAIVCIHNMVEMSKTHMFAVERPNLSSAWEITARISLDVPEFHAANWIFEPQDVDGDGFEEVIFKGATEDGMTHRFLIYVPRTRQNYSMIRSTDANGKQTQTLSANAQVQNGAAFRKALEQMAQAK